MKAIVYHNYGSPDVLKFEEVEKPVPKDNEVLLKVRAASVNPLDWHFMRGEPYLARIMAGGLRKPKTGRLGADVAGQVEAVGRSVTQFNPGDEVFGTCRGALAQYVCAPESRLVMKPNTISFEQAASVPVAALTALRGLRNNGHVQPGYKVLINGAAGGVGTFAVQMAKSFGADVTGVCSTRNVEMIRSLGADHVVDYTQADFTKTEQRYDVILDNMTNHPLSAIRRILKPRGIFAAVGGSSGPWMLEFLALLFKMLLLSGFSKRKWSMVMAKANKEDLNAICQLIETGKVKPVIDRSYQLSEAPEAIRYLETGHARGKVVVTIQATGNSSPPASPD
ncbi:MAG TPA: NAD(P)-dependent alcohol dehydrogenase [Candidatus Angelobacter sp.]